MKRLNTQEKINLDIVRNSLLGVMIAIFLLFGWSLFNTWNKNQATREQIVQQKEQLITLGKNIETLNSLVSKYTKESDALKKKLFRDIDVASFVKRLSKLAGENKISLVDILAKNTARLPTGEKIIKAKKGKAAKQESLFTLAVKPLRITIKGSFSQISRFLLSLEKSNKLLSISDVEIKTVTYPILSYKFTLNLYSVEETEIFKVKK